MNPRGSEATSGRASGVMPTSADVRRALEQFVESRRASGDQFQHESAISGSITVNDVDVERVRSVWQVQDDEQLGRELNRVRGIGVGGEALESGTRQNLVRQFRGLLHVRASQGAYVLGSGPGGGARPGTSRLLGVEPVIDRVLPHRERSVSEREQGTPRSSVAEHASEPVRQRRSGRVAAASPLLHASPSDEVQGRELRQHTSLGSGAEETRLHTSPRRLRRKVSRVWRCRRCRREELLRWM